MGRIFVHEFVSLDGVFESPSWTAEFGFDPQMGEALAAITGTSSALLLGRVTYEMFAPAWSARSPEDDPGVPFFNDSPKHVVTSADSLSVPWQNAQVFGPYSPEAIGRLKAETDGDLYISGSGRLVRALLDDGLVDQLHLFVYPVVLGAGPRLFPEGTGRVGLTLGGVERYDNGVLHLTYGP
jgi:dihydrofolate reductase